MTNQTQEKPRLFFDCPIKAAYMAKYFGVRYNVKVEGGSEFVTYTPYDMSKGKQVDQVITSFIIAPESEEIFEPKEGDFGVNSYGNLQTIYDSEDSWVSTPNNARSGSIENSRIIMRNEKIFFSPAKEEK